MKIVFLDVDGVLNSRQYMLSLGPDIWDNPDNQIDPAAVARLNQITQKTDAKIVVSSTWRYAFINDAQGLYRLQDLMLQRGIDADIIGMTPDLASLQGGIFLANGTRGTEIQAWVDDNPDIDQLVVIDDGDVPGFADRQVKTDFDTGLLDLHVQQAIALLGPKGN